MLCNTKPVRCLLAVVSAYALVAAGDPPRAAAQSLAQRLGLAAPSEQAPQPATQQQAVRHQNLMHDPAVRPAAVAEMQPRAARERTSGTPRRTSTGGSFLSRFKLPNLLPGGGSNSADFADAPPAYGPAPAANGQRTQAGARAPQAGTRAPQQTTNSRQAGTPAQRHAPTAQQAPRRTAITPAPPGGTNVAPAPMQAPVSRVARSSPRPSDRHNELADALTGLRSSPTADMPATDASEANDAASEATEDTAQITPPAADDGELAPSYLYDEEDSIAAESAPPAATRRGSNGSLDFHEALLGGDDAPAAAPPMPPRASTTTRRATTAQPARRQSTQTTPTQTTQATPARATPQRSAPVNTDVAAALSGGSTTAARPQATGTGRYSTQQQGTQQLDQQQEQQLGAIAAQSAPPSYEAAEPVSRPALPTTSRTTNENATTSRPAATPSYAGNLRAKRDVLLSCEPPLLVSNVTGPQRIAVGRTAEYRVVVENRGAATAREMTATIAVPSWADVVDAAATNGAVDRTTASAEGESHEIIWRLYELTGGATQTLTLQVIPRSGRQLQLSVQCDQAPTSAEAVVDVQEPQLQMEITGPAEVMFGKSQRYSLTLSNPGTGDADDVLIELVPPGGDAKAPVRHKIGVLAAGASKTIELELTAREAGELKVVAAAMAAGDLRSEAVKTVLCRKAELDVDWRGPDKSFSGAVATYFIRVRNPGTAPAEQVGIELNLPAGTELVDASAGHAWDADRRMVVWKAGSLGAREERFMQVRCKMATPGTNQMELVARTAAGDLSDVHQAPVTVVALADLKLQVSDPQGVIPVGQTALYEIRVQNRGMIAARGVNVAAMFSSGVDPSHVEGGQYEIRDGRVTFRTIDTLPAGAEVVLRVHAKATQAGTHVFRTEVVCDDLETKLAAEETTRYFVEEERWADASAAYSDGETTR